MGQDFDIGERVRVVSKHWLRGGHVGTIEAFDIEKLSCKWTVAFDKETINGGFMEEIDGEMRQCLCMDGNQLERIL